MPIPRIRFMHAVLPVAIGLLALSSVAQSGPPGAAKQKPQPVRNQVSVYSVEFDGACGPPVMPGKLGAIITSSAPRGWSLKAGGAAPLVSHEAVLYSVVGTSGLTSLPAARVFAEVRGGGELSFKSDKGQDVVLQADVKSVCWDVDPERAVALARGAGAARTLIAVMHWEDMTADVNPDGEFGKQRSMLVSLEMTLIDAVSGTVLGSFADETRQMDLSSTAAVRRGAKLLAEKGFQSLASDEN